MDKAKCEESPELDRSPALCEGRIARSNTDVRCSATASIDSFDYSRTASEISILSEPPDVSSCEASPMGWPMAKLMAQPPAILTKLGTKRYDRVLLHGKAEAKEVSGAATVFGQFRKLEPLPPGKKSMWRREMDWLLSVCDYIVEFAPSVQNLPDGTTLEEILESFRSAEFWYVEEGDRSPHAGMMGSFRRVIHRNDEKWWLPVPCVPAEGLPEKSCKRLRQKRECAHQIHKAAMAINGGILAEMEVPDSYLAALPKSGKASLGDAVYRYITTTDQYSPEYLIGCVEISSEHEALEFADRVEASMHIWRRKASMHHSKSSWDLVSCRMLDRQSWKATQECWRVLHSTLFPGLMIYCMLMDQLRNLNNNATASQLEVHI